MNNNSTSKDKKRDRNRLKQKRLAQALKENLSRRKASKQADI